MARSTSYEKLYGVNEMIVGITCGIVWCLLGALCCYISNKYYDSALTRGEVLGVSCLGGFLALWIIISFITSLDWWREEAFKK